MFRRLTKLVIAAAVASVLLVPVAAVGSHDFTDVPDSNTFHADISWLLENDVTKGCNPPVNDEFCPDANVTRGQMAAFMHRLADGKIVHAATAVTADSASTASTADSATTAVRATDADDAALLDGMSADDLKTLTFVAMEVDQGTGVFATPNVEMMTLDFEVPVAGSILITHSTSLQFDVAPTAIAVAPTLDGCLGPFFIIASYAEVSAGDEYDSAAGVLAMPIEAGAHTISYCGSVESADVSLLNTQLGVVFEPGGVVPDLPLPPVMMSTDSSPWN